MKRTDPYNGPFPRKRHSHRCLGCGDINSVACYKQKCTRPQTCERCSICGPRLDREAAAAKPKCKHCGGSDDVQPTSSGPQCAGCRALGEIVKSAWRIATRG